MSKEVVKVTKFVDISKKIKETISLTANEAALDKFVQKSADLEITRRAELLDKGYSLWKTTEKEIEKCTEDQVQHIPVAGNENEFVKQRTFSDAKFKEREALRKRRSDLEVALMLALGDAQDYSKLEELIKKNPAKKDNNKETKTDE